MRNLTLVVAVLLLGFTSIVAQDKTASDYVKEGAEAYKQKDYASGLESFEAAIRINEANNEVDTNLFYNAAICAYKTKKFDKAAQYFGRSADYQFKVCKSLLYRANALKKANKFDAMEETLEKGVASCPNNKDKFEGMLAKHYLKQGLKYYNQGAKKQEAATGYMESDRDKYDQELDKAKTLFKKAQPYLEKAHKIDPSEKAAIQALVGVYESLGMQEKAQEMKAKL